MTHRIFAKLILTCAGPVAVAALGVDQLVTRLNTQDLREDLERGLHEKALMAQTVLEDRPVERHPAIAHEIAGRLRPAPR